MSTSHADDRIARLEFETDTLSLLVGLMIASDSLKSTSPVDKVLKVPLTALFVAQFGLYCYTYIPKVYSYASDNLESLRKND